MAIEAVIFDFGGVFTSSPLEAFARFERERGLPETFIGGVIKTNHHANAWARFERAEIGLDAFDEAFAAETRAAGFEITGRTLVSLLAFTLHAQMAEALGRVSAAGYKTGCITNTLPQAASAAMVAAPDRGTEDRTKGDRTKSDRTKSDRTKNLRAKDDTAKAVGAILKRFDHVIESAKAGMRKPEPRIYEMMCEALAVSPERCVFLDDLGVNLKPARAMGMTTIKVPLGDVTPAIDELGALLDLPLR